MITEAEIAWLETNHPTLKVNAERTEVSGDLKFVATYDAEADEFTWLTSPGQTAQGVVLSNTYKVLIKKDENDRCLPILKVEVEGVKRIIDRHFYADGNACLCGPVEACEFFEQDFSFLRYLETLIVPFLYSQTFYDTYSKWPWGEYIHGTAGVFESYYRNGKTREHIEACLRQLRKDKNWPRIKAVLSGRERVVETSKCFCASPGQIRRCHSHAWTAMLKLRKDLRDQGIRLDD